MTTPAQCPEQARQPVPLLVPPDWPHTRLRGRLFRFRLPLLGQVRFRFGISKFRKLDAMVEERLKERSLTLAEAWSEFPELLGVAQELQPILNSQLWGFGFTFLPADSYALLGQWLTGDLCEVECSMAIEERFGFEFPYDFDRSPWTMMDLVRFIHENRTR